MTTHKSSRDDPKVLRSRILHLLTIYPVISPTMLQCGLGPSVKPQLWRPILQRLIDTGEVIQENQDATTVIGRYNSYTKLSLPGTKVKLAETA